MINVFLKSRSDEYNASGVFNKSNKELTVLRESLISSEVAGGMFRSSKSVKEQRERFQIKDRRLMEDITFKSASSAANFVTGRSTNGLIAWKTNDGITLKDLLESEL